MKKPSSPSAMHILKAAFSITGEGRRLFPGGVAGKVVAVCSVVSTLYVLWLAIFGVATEHLQISAFITFLLPIVFLTTTASKRIAHLTAIDWLLAALSFALGIWYVVNEEKYQNWMRGISELSTADVVTGVLLVVIVIEICRRAVGWGLTGVVVVLVAYVAVGPWLEGAFHHDVVTLHYFLDMQTIGVDGLFGTPLYVASSYAFLFVLFGSFYTAAGGGQLFFDVAAALTGRMVGGPAKACVVSSGLYGSISGSPTADVATTGPINIPIMRRIGMDPKRAGATEAAASCGGAMLPPVMGAVAFLMADFTGIAYHEIIKSAFLAAVLYYVGVFLLVHLEAQRCDLGRVPPEHIVGLGEALRRGGINLIPIGFLLYFLLEGYSPAYVAAGATAAVVVASWLNPRRAIGPKRFVDACVDTTHRMVPLLAAVAAAGLIIGCIELTGLSGKFTVLMFSLSGGLLVPTLLASMVILILLGMGMPTPGVYIMGVALVAPVLIGHFELPVLEVHMFMLYFSCMSAITPPVAVACFTAGAIAGASPMAISPYACKLAVGGFILPFFFLFNPGLLLQGGVADIVSAFVLGLALVVTASIALHGWVNKKALPVWLRLVLALLGVGIIYPRPELQYAAAAVSLACFAALRHLAQLEAGRQTVGNA